MALRDHRKSRNNLTVLAQQSRALHLAVMTCILLVLVFLIDCRSFISYYDPTTYKNLTDLKPEVAFLYETFVSDSVDLQKVAEIRLRLAQVYEYEKGKGAKNQETYEQIEIIQNMFARHVKDRLEQGKWSKEHMENTNRKPLTLQFKPKG